MTGNQKIDVALFIAGYALFILSEALGKSKRFQGNGVVQFFCKFVSAGWQGVKTSPCGLLEHAIEFTGPIVEKQIEASLNASVTQTSVSQSVTTTAEVATTTAQVDSTPPDPINPNDPNGLNRI
jgi:hypothetical protein